MAKSSVRSNILNCPINMFAVSIDGFFKNGSCSIFSDAARALSSYVKYMGYSHVLFLDGKTVATADLTPEKKRTLTDALHSSGIKLFFCLTPRDVTDKKLYIYTILDQIKEQGFDGLYFDIPLPHYSDKALLRQLNKEIHDNFPDFITILGNKDACDSRAYGFDMILDYGPYDSACNYVAFDPYFRKHIQSDFEDKILSSNKSSRMIARSRNVSADDFKSILSSSFGTHSDKLKQKRAIDLLLVTASGKNITVMGDEFSGAYVENSHPMVDWSLLDTDEYRNLRSFTRALNYFYLENKAIYSSADDELLSICSDSDKDKNVIAFKRSSANDTLITVVNLSGIEQCITISESGVPECVFATEEYIGNAGVKGTEDGYSITLPAFCGAVYRLK